MLEHEQSETTRNRLATIEATSGKYGDVFTNNYLTELRRDWPE